MKASRSVAGRPTCRRRVAGAGVRSSWPCRAEPSDALPTSDRLVEHEPPVATASVSSSMAPCSSASRLAQWSTTEPWTDVHDRRILNPDQSWAGSIAYGARACRPPAAHRPGALRRRRASPRSRSTRSRRRGRHALRPDQLAGGVRLGASRTTAKLAFDARRTQTIARPGNRWRRSAGPRHGTRGTGRERGSSHVTAPPGLARTVDTICPDRGSSRTSRAGSPARRRRAVRRRVPSGTGSSGRTGLSRKFPDESPRIHHERQ